MPKCGVVLKDHGEILSFEQITAVARAGVGMGITKIRLTGGEPLVRRHIERLVALLSAIEGVQELCMTTNGVLLPEMAAKLKSSGLDRVNISIDSLDEKRYRQITGGGELKGALAGVDAAIEAKLEPVKINMVVLEDTTDEEIEAMRQFCGAKNIELQKIMQFSLYDRAELSRRIETQRPPKCSRCNRIRVTADGFVKPCLFSEDEVKIDFDNVAGAIGEAVLLKPEIGISCRNRPMSQIGG